MKRVEKAMGSTRTGRNASGHIITAPEMVTGNASYHRYTGSYSRRKSVAAIAQRLKQQKSHCISVSTKRN
ncbi:hypothetical protein [Agathobacter rectalis]|uniref:hypothetical protein n=1 Tax=Agathobacter rectalis TaxID=39491 RepID=UPI0012B0158E|nr:hypothetical protein [Agathobacter rectalis]MSD18188.1 hypothetical protein [Agathobacter rectalis]MSD20656.1 hypothetical protein [Agathobacter rectalis]